MLLALALAWAEALGARDLFLGVNALDYSGYPDCRPEFLRAFEGLAALATAAGTEHGVRFRVHAPLLALTKKEIVLRAEALGVDPARLEILIYQLVSFRRGDELVHLRIATTLIEDGQVEDAPQGAGFGLLIAPVRELGGARAVELLLAVPRLL